MYDVIIFYGPPGSGKTTISKNIKSALSCPTVSVNEIINHILTNKLEGYRVVHKAVVKGRLVSDSTLLPYLEQAIHRVSGDTYILDGYPRTPEQFEHLLPLVSMNKIISFYFDLDKQVILKRLQNRLYCPSCGHPFISVAGGPITCPHCNRKTEKRIDDSADIIEKRINQYNSSMEKLTALLEMHTIFHRIHADMPVNTLAELCLTQINKDSDIR